MRLLPIASAFLLVAVGALSLPAAEFSITLAEKSAAPVADAVISLHPLDQPAPPAAADTPELVIAQINGEFTPLVSAVRAGTRVSFPNRDRVQHQVYSLSPAKRFEIPLHGGEQAAAELFDKPGLVAIGCNIHDWMRAYVLVLDTPWFAVSPAEGTVRLSAPAGRYRLEIWHHRMAQMDTREVVLAEAAPLAELATLALRRDRRPPRAINSDAAGYR